MPKQSRRQKSTPAPALTKAPSRQSQHQGAQHAPQDRGLATSSLDSLGQAGDTVLGWASDAGDWFADGYDSAVEMGAKAVDGVVDLAGTVKEAALEVGDDIVASSFGQAAIGANHAALAAGDAVARAAYLYSVTDFSADEDTLSATVDLDELMPILPESAQKLLKMGGPQSSNKVELKYDESTKEITISAPDLQLGEIKGEAFSVGSTVLTGVVITITNHDGGIPFLDGDFTFKDYTDKKDNIKVTVAIDKGIGTDITFKGEKGPVHADMVVLTTLSVDASAKDGLPLGDSGNTVINFTLADAVLSGLDVKTKDEKNESHKEGAKSLHFTTLHGSLSEKDANANVHVDKLEALDVYSDDTTVGSATLNNVDTAIDNEKGGLLFLDDKTDARTSNVKIESAFVDNVVDGKTTIKHAEVNKIETQDTKTGVKFKAQDGKIDGLKSEAAQVDHLDLSTLKGNMTTPTMSTGLTQYEAQLESLSGKGIGFQGQSIEKASAKGLSVQQGEKSFKVGADEVDLKGYKGEQNTVRSVLMSKVSSEQTGTKTKIHADHVFAQGANLQSKGGNLKVNSVGLSGVDAQLGEEGRTDATVKTVDGRGIGYQGHSVEQAKVKDLSVKKRADSLKVEADKLDVKGYRGEQGTVQSLSMSKVSSEQVGDETKLQADKLSAKMAHLKSEGTQVDVDALDVTKIGATVNKTEWSATANEVSGEGADFHRVSSGSKSSSDSKSSLDSKSSSDSKSSGEKRTGEAFDVQKLIQSVVKRIDNADASFSVPVRAGEFRQGGVGVGVAKDTHVTGNIKVRDNTLAAGSHADVVNSKGNAQPLDGPAWVTGQGAYVDKENQARMILGGAPDISVNSPLNSALGIKGEKMQSLSDYDAAIRRKKEEKDAEVAKAAAAPPVKKHRTMKVNPKYQREEKVPKPSLDRAIDLGHLNAKGTVGFSGGLINGGGVKVNLMDGDAKTNVLDVKNTGGESFVGHFVHFLVSSLSLQAGGATISSKTTSLKDATVTHNYKDTSTSGHIGAVKIEDLKASGKLAPT